MKNNKQGVLNYIKRCDHTPTHREISEHVGISAPMVGIYLIQLETDGKITVTKKQGKRAIKVINS